MKVAVKQSVGMCGIEIISEDEGECRAAERMTRFYDKLFEELSLYRNEQAQERRSLRYNIEVEYLQDSVKISLILMLREGGKRIAEKHISHEWKKDVIIHSDTSQINI